MSTVRDFYDHYGHVTVPRLIRALVQAAMDFVAARRSQQWEKMDGFSAEQEAHRAIAAWLRGESVLE